MRVLISGASGLVGTELTRQLREDGHEAIRLVRGPAKTADEISWNPSKGQIDPEIMERVDAVVNLAGATTGRIPWTAKYKKEIVSSRIDSTRTLVTAINRAGNPPKVLISGSASGFYGEGGSTWLSEDSPKGKGFLSDLAHNWEQEAMKARARVVLVRTTLVMSRKKGALGPLMPLLKLGVGGPIGSGKQFWAWINLVDEAAAIIHLITTPGTHGPYNLTAPEPATCEEMIVGLGKAIRRPTFFRIPEFLMKLFIGEAAEELLLVSQKMTANKLLASGFRFRYPDLNSSINWAVARSK
ncbi:MAG: TIGR01777 family oxidoreductase [Micrococcales bacterium]|nr:TIGR01777 family oxidoreductase [Micrococcales bacterium]